MLERIYMRQMEINEEKDKWEKIRRYVRHLPSRKKAKSGAGTL